GQCRLFAWRLLAAERTLIGFARRMVREDMDLLWAPWRLSYVTTNKPGGDGPCFICRGLADDDDRANLIVWRTPHSVAIVNRFPYNNGHLLVSPRAHKARLDE